MARPELKRNKIEGAKYSLTLTPTSGQSIVFPGRVILVILVAGRSLLRGGPTEWLDRFREGGTDLSSDRLASVACWCAGGLAAPPALACGVILL